MGGQNIYALVWEPVSKQKRLLVLSQKHCFKFRTTNKAPIQIVVLGSVEEVGMLEVVRPGKKIPKKIE